MSDSSPERLRQTLEALHRPDSGRILATLGGILVLEARDLNHTIQLISHHPGVKYGPWEIRPAADLEEMIRESEWRRGKGRTAVGRG